MAFKDLFGIFVRAQELRNDPLLVKGFSGTELDELIDELHYIGPERDLENRRKDKENLAKDFGKAFQAAKIRLGV